MKIFTTVGTEAHLVLLKGLADVTWLFNIMNNVNNYAENKISGILKRRMENFLNCRINKFSPVSFCFVNFKDNYFIIISS